MVVQQKLESELESSPIAEDRLHRRRDVGAHAHLVLLSLRHKGWQDAGDEIRRPHAIATQRHTAAVEVRNLGETLHRIARLLGGVSRGAEHLFLILVEIAEVILEKDVQREADFVEPLERVA
jgi:hypothetical protein